MPDLRQASSIALISLLVPGRGANERSPSWLTDLNEEPEMLNVEARGLEERIAEKVGKLLEAGQKDSDRNHNNKF